MLINLSNHPSSKWSKEQLSAANTAFGEVVDLPFPEVNPMASKEEVEALASTYIAKCNNMFEAYITSANADETAWVHVMGEMTFVHAFVQKSSFSCCASTSKRDKVDVVNPDGTTTMTWNFKFCQFRPY